MPGSFLEGKNGGEKSLSFVSVGTVSDETKTKNMEPEQIDANWCT